MVMVALAVAVVGCSKDRYHEGYVVYEETWAEEGSTSTAAGGWEGEPSEHGFEVLGGSYSGIFPYAGNVQADNAYTTGWIDEFAISMTLESPQLEPWTMVLIDKWDDISELEGTHTVDILGCASTEEGTWEEPGESGEVVITVNNDGTVTGTFTGNFGPRVVTGTFIGQRW